MFFICLFQPYEFIISLLFALVYKKRKVFIFFFIFIYRTKINHVTQTEPKNINTPYPKKHIMKNNTLKYSCHNSLMTITSHIFLHYSKNWIRMQYPNPIILINLRHHNLNYNCGRYYPYP